MDQEVLVSEQIDAGARFVAELDKALAVKVAFWLKRSDDPHWNLYIASDKLSAGNTHEGYRHVVEVYRKLQEPFLELADLKLIPADDSIATAVMEIQQRHHSATLARFFRDSYLGGVVAEGLFIYPSQAAVPTS